MKKLLILLVALGLPHPLVAGEERLSDLILSGQAIGPDWSDPTGIIIDDLASEPDSEELPVSVKEGYLKLGVVALCDQAYRFAEDSFDQVVVRIFIFSDDAKLQDWMDQKYGYDGWQEHYKKSERDGMQIWDSTQIDKRIVAFGKYWITCHTLASEKQHLMVLDKYVSELKE